LIIYLYIIYHIFEDNGVYTPMTHKGSADIYEYIYIYMNIYIYIYICVVHMFAYSYVILEPREVGGGSQHVASNAMCLAHPPPRSFKESITYKEVAWC